MSYSDRWVREYLARRDAGQTTEDSPSEYRHAPPRNPSWPFITAASPLLYSHATAQPQPITSFTRTTPPLPSTEAAIAKPGCQPTDLVTQARALRERLQLSQQDFATHLGISPRTLQDWEQGRRRPRGPAQALLRQHLERLEPSPAAIPHQDIGDRMTAGGS